MRAEGFRTLSVSTGEQGIVAAREQQPSVITLDIFLPGMDGWEVLRTLNADAELRRIPGVIVTISSDRHKALALGAHEHLVKPINQCALADALPARAMRSADA